MSFQEADLEKLIVDLISQKGYTYVHGDNLNRDFEDVLIEDDLRSFLTKRYQANDITTSEINRTIMSLKSVSTGSLYDANKTIFKKIVSGEILIRDDKTKKDFTVSLIDFNNIKNNIIKVCNQVIIKGLNEKRIPDTIIYVNGLPLVVWEYKSTTREDATIYDAFVQITTRYTRDIPELFKYNAFVVISDGVNSKMGSLFADYEHFFAWRKVNDGDTEKDGIDSLFTMINGLFEPNRLFDVIHNFIFFPDSSSTKEIKIVCNYPQYFAATKISKNVLKHRKPIGDGKGGTYFGTTGCGKSYGMLFLSRLLMKSSELESPTIVLITDRTDLDDQLSAIFQEAKEFIGDKEIVSIESREELGTKLRGKASGGVYLTTIQKFEEKLNLLSDRSNIICISDEAHRSQLNLDEKIKITDKEVKKTYGFAKYLHDSLPNATFVGFTGTPIDETLNVFGDIVEEYTMRDSIRDGITVRLVYDGRFAKAVLDPEKLAEIEQYYEDCLNSGSNEYQVEESKKSIGINNIIGDENILKDVADCFIQHYEARISEGSSVAGKCMFVCADRKIAYKFWKILKDKRPSWIEERKAPVGIELTEEQEKKLKPMPMMKIVATHTKDDEKALYDMLGTDEDRKEAATQFKDINSNFKIAIVVDMWLTGFDVPFLDAIYIDKLLKQEHNIIQTISRVNRAFPGKDSGLIVDFVGIKYGMNLALKKYAKYDQEDVDGIEHAITIVRDQIDVLNAMFNNFDSSLYFDGSNIEKLQCLNKAVEYVQLTKELENRFMAAVRRMSKAFKLCNGAKDFTEEELDTIHYYMAIRSVLYKLTKGTAPDLSSMNAHVASLIEEAIKSNGVEELFKKERDLNLNAIDLFDQAYLDKINKIKLPNTKVKILEQLLNNAIEEFKKVNKIKAITFSQRLQGLVDKYNDRVADPAQVQNILNDIADQMIELMKNLAKEKKSFEEMGINYEEKAFFDILVSVEEKYEFDYPNEKNLELAKLIYNMVKDLTRYSDWVNRDDIRAEMQAEIIVMLAENGFPPIPDDVDMPEDYIQVYKDVIEQAENFRKYSVLPREEKQTVEYNISEDEGLLMVAEKNPKYGE